MHVRKHILDNPIDYDLNHGRRYTYAGIDGPFGCSMPCRQRICGRSSAVIVTLMSASGTLLNAATLYPRPSPPCSQPPCLFRDDEGSSFLADTSGGIRIIHFPGHPMRFFGLEYACSKVSALKYGAHKVTISMLSSLQFMK